MKTCILFTNNLTFYTYFAIIDFTKSIDSDRFFYIIPPNMPLLEKYVVSCRLPYRVMPAYNSQIIDFFKNCFVSFNTDNVICYSLVATDSVKAAIMAANSLSILFDESHIGNISLLPDVSGNIDKLSLPSCFFCDIPLSSDKFINDNFRYSEVSRIQTRSALQLVDTYSIGFIDFFDKDSNGDSILDIAASLGKDSQMNMYEADFSKHRPLYTFVFAGHGPLYAELAARSAYDDLDNCCKFVGITDRLTSLLSALDLVILPSVHDSGFLRKICEVMSLPVLEQKNVSTVLPTLVPSHAKS